MHVLIRDPTNALEISGHLCLYLGDPTNAGETFSHFLGMDLKNKNSAHALYTGILQASLVNT